MKEKACLLQPNDYILTAGVTKKQEKAYLGKNVFAFADELVFFFEMMMRTLLVAKCSLLE